MQPKKVQKKQSCIRNEEVSVHLCIVSVLKLRFYQEQLGKMNYSTEQHHPIWPPRVENKAQTAASSSSVKCLFVCHSPFMAGTLRLLTANVLLC